MRFKKLKRPDHPQGFVDAAAKRQIVNQLVADDAFLVDQKQAAQGDSVGKKHVVRTRTEL